LTIVKVVVIFDIAASSTYTSVPEVPAFPRNVSRSAKALLSMGIRGK
jgi:hypothetical protein